MYYDKYMKKYYRYVNVGIIVDGWKILRGFYGKDVFV